MSLFFLISILSQGYSKVNKPMELNQNSFLYKIHMNCIALIIIALIIIIIIALIDEAALPVSVAVSGEFHYGT